MAVSAVKKETAKHQDDADAPAAAPSNAKKKGKLLKLMIVLVLTAGLGGGAYWYLNQNKSAKPATAKPEPTKPPVFVPLEPFTVNLQLEENPQFLQTGLSLKVADNAVVEALKVHMPDIRDRILLLLSARKASELLTVEGKRKLSIDIVASINAILAPAPSNAAPRAKKAPAEPKPPADGDAATPAEGEEKTAEEAATPAPAPAPAAAPSPPVLAVLFTAFIIQ